MKRLNLMLSVCLLASAGYANTHSLQPGQVAFVQKKDGSWIEIKNKEPATVSGFFSSTFNCVATGTLLALAYFGTSKYADTRRINEALDALLHSNPQLKAIWEEGVKAELGDIR